MKSKQKSLAEVWLTRRNPLVSTVHKTNITYWTQLCVDETVIFNAFVHEVAGSLIKVMLGQ